ncbi:glycosyltransferase family 2 protein [Urechidicola croceus]|uniref:Glycosyltransferase 2-like domain-containing protein n=1 Tax=Urechidicola croceus TaxID=1850246 RepID=A0A1D8P4L7_9FLAO|nr:glycosyltransferase family 2 protein [Urechidicola croceus]AOW19504.1 hypothetical protein LPB138_01880 [Urechidicola croceus]
MRLSIIIPTYNSEKVLNKALKSIINQSFKDVEVLIIDGLSKDKTLKIAKEFQKEIPSIIIKSEKDNGIYDAMNKGIKLANGEWLFFMGSDDTLFDNYTLEKVFESISKTKEKVIYGNVKIVGDTGWAKNGDIYDGEFSIEKLFNQNICHQSMFYNSKFIKKDIGFFNLNYDICSDWDFNLRCRAKTNFYYCNIIIANFFSGGLSTNSGDKEFSIDFINNIMDYYKINLFNKLLNSPSFKRHPEVKTLQKKKHPYRFKFLKLVKQIFKRLEIK